MVEYIHNDDMDAGLAGVKPSDCALLVIDALGKVEGTPLEDVLPGGAREEHTGRVRQRRALRGHRPRA